METNRPATEQTRQAFLPEQLRKVRIIDLMSRKALVESLGQSAFECGYTQPGALVADAKGDLWLDSTVEIGDELTKAECMVVAATSRGVIVDATHIPKKKARWDNMDLTCECFEGIEFIPVAEFFPPPIKPKRS